jgi:uncharacterized protein
MSQPRIRRLVPEVPLPPYTFVPGRTPHPHSPAGHSFGVEAGPVEPLDPERWRDHRAYLLGIDLFNAGFFWEAHEAWEGVWLACGRRGMIADFIKGLIKLAAAGVKHLEGKPAGVKSHAGRAAELWRAIRADVFLGLRVGELVGLADEVRARGWPAAPPLLLPQ